jgi:hypothetical protein
VLNLDGIHDLRGAGIRSEADRIEPVRSLLAVSSFPWFDVTILAINQRCTELANEHHRVRANVIVYDMGSGRQNIPKISDGAPWAASSVSLGAR